MIEVQPAGSPCESTQLPSHPAVLRIESVVPRCLSLPSVGVARQRRKAGEEHPPGAQRISPAEVQSSS